MHVIWVYLTNRSRNKGITNEKPSRRDAEFNIQNASYEEGGISKIRACVERIRKREDRRIGEKRDI
jgi:hypothetical protein